MYRGTAISSIKSAYYSQEPNNSNNLCGLRALCGDQNHTPQRTQRAQSVQDICQRYYVLDYKYRQPPSPPLVCLRFGLRLPILGNFARYFAVPHCSFSSIESGPGRGDFSQEWDMIFSLMSCLFVFLFYASRHASDGIPRIKCNEA